MFYDLYVDQSDQKIEKNRPIFGNVAKTVAKISKIQNIYISNCYLILIEVQQTMFLNCSFV
jgi:hypothetical protein